MPTRGALISRLREPAYTGENRCIPCTAVNVAIAAVLAWVVAAALGSLAGDGTGLAAGVVVFAGSALLVYLRGYLLPGTPELTRRYLPDRVLAWFDKEPPAVASAGPDPVDLPDDEFDLVDPEELLRDAGAIEPCAEHDLCLTDGFESALLAAAERMTGGGDAEDARLDALRTLLEPADEARIATEDGRPVAYDGGERRNGWPSEAAMVADLAAHRALSERESGWAEVVATQKFGILQALRGFLTTCPVCGGSVAMTEDTVESCCRSWDVLAVRCGDCEAHFMELDPGQFDEQLADEIPGPTEGGFTQ